MLVRQSSGTPEGMPCTVAPTLSNSSAVSAVGHIHATKLNISAEENAAFAPTMTGLVTSCHIPTAPNGYARGAPNTSSAVSALLYAGGPSVPAPRHGFPSHPETPAARRHRTPTWRTEPGTWNRKIEHSMRGSRLSGHRAVAFEPVSCRIKPALAQDRKQP